MDSGSSDNNDVIFFTGAATSFRHGSRILATRINELGCTFNTFLSVMVTVTVTDALTNPICKQTIGLGTYTQTHSKMFVGVEIIVSTFHFSGITSERIASIATSYLSPHQKANNKQTTIMTRLTILSIQLWPCNKKRVAGYFQFSYFQKLRSFIMSHAEI